MSAYMDEGAVRGLLAAAVEAEGSQKRLAHEIGVSASFINDVLLERRAPTGKLLKWLGFEKIELYRPLPGRHRTTAFTRTGVNTSETK